MTAREQLNINRNLLKNLKKIALQINRSLVELINEILTNYTEETNTDKTKNMRILDELYEVKNRISNLGNLKG